MCLCLYLFVGFSQVQTALVISSALADSHDVGLVNDGNHQDVVFKHHHPAAQEKIQPLAHMELPSIFNTYSEPHPDPVMHLPQPLEEISAQVSELNFDTSDLYDLDTLIAVNGPLNQVCPCVSLQTLPQPPPLLTPLSSLDHLRTVVLLI